MGSVTKTTSLQTDVLRHDSLDYMQFSSASVDGAGDGYDASEPAASLSSASETAASLPSASEPASDSSPSEPAALPPAASQQVPADTDDGVVKVSCFRNILNIN